MNLGVIVHCDLNYFYQICQNILKLVEQLFESIYSHSTKIKELKRVESKLELLPLHKLGGLER